MRRARNPAGSVLAASLAVSLGLAGSCGTMPRSRPGLVPAPPATAQAFPPLPAAPVIRVGILTDVPRVSIGADAGLLLRATAIRPGEARPLARATFVPVSAVGAATRFRVQVASVADAAGAREASEQARGATGLEPQVRWSPETRTHQVRLGDFPTRQEAQAVVGRLDRAGMAGGWIVEEAGSVSVGRIRLLETGEEFAVADLAPARPQDVLSADGMPYRGLLQVRPSENGALTVINTLNLEDYVKGVVPNELSPQVFPQLEAQKAQAVAARTYALRNLGQFEARGYDICATPTCQVYRGHSSEHPLSTQAVEETADVTAANGGGLINALYTSTCGGHTEDVENIFEGPEVSYLRGVACVPEREAWTTIRTSVPPPALGDLEGLGRDAALLAALQVLEPGFYSAGALAGEAADEEVRGWVSRLLSALQRQGCPSAAEAPLSRRGTFFRHLVSSLCWEERGRRLLAPGDTDYLLQLEDRAELTGDLERLAAALLVQEGIVSPFPDNTLRPNARLTRAEAVAALAQTVARAGAPAFQSATLRDARAGLLTVESGEGQTESHPLNVGVQLFRAFNGHRLGASELHLLAGDRVRFVRQGDRVIFLEAEQSRLGAAADRTSRVYRWEVRLTPEEVAKAVARYGSVGAVRDVRPLRLGVSGRVVELAVVGSEGELLLKGLKVRWGLGLRENLFVVDRETDAEGTVTRFIFTGKGWGHGVGLCQVGASGMAQAGASYDRILKHYYSGIHLKDGGAGPSGSTRSF